MPVVDVHPTPGSSFDARAQALYDRLGWSWFRSEWRAKLDDGCRMAGKDARTWRGIRLFAFWWFRAASPLVVK